MRPSTTRWAICAMFIKQVEARGELMVVRDADPHLEIGALYELSQEEPYPPALMFEAMKGCDPGFRILCNVRNARLLVGDLTLDALKAYRRRPTPRAASRFRRAR